MPTDKGPHSWSSNNGGHIDNSWKELQRGLTQVSSYFGYIFRMILEKERCIRH